MTNSSRPNEAATYSLKISLKLSREQYLHYYRGAAKAIVARADDSRLIQFPASALQAFITHTGVDGDFSIQFDAQHKLLGITRISRNL